METAALCKPIQRFADLLRIPGTWVLTGLGKLLAALGSFPHFPQPLRLLHTHLYWRFLECQLIEVTLTQNGHLTHHEIPSVASLRPGGYFPRIGWPVSPEYADGSSGVERLATRQFFSHASSWSPDGKALALQDLLQDDPSGNIDISILLKEEGATPRPFIASPHHEWGLKFSPDGRWIAYFSDETGSKSLYVRAYPGADVTWLVLGKQDFRMWRSSLPVWSPDGSELFHYDGEKMKSVSVQMELKFKASQPRVLFEGSYLPQFDISPDGQRFLMVKQEDLQINVVLNWFEELKRLVPVTTG